MIVSSSIKRGKSYDDLKSNKRDEKWCATSTHNKFLLNCAFLVFFVAGMNAYAIMQSSLRLTAMDNIYAHIGPKVITHPQAKYKQTSPRMTKRRMERLKGPNGPKYSVMVTGAAGFIGMHTAIELKKMGMTPIGYDNVNQYYAVELKESRIEELKKRDIAFVRGDVCDVATLKSTIKEHNITRFIHLAAQAGVRYSLDHPLEYTRNNVDCTVNILEVMVELGLKEDPLVYASSSSVYGNNVKIPFQETDRVEDPASLYAATKRSDELIAQTYFNLHNVSSIGLRFFTVYGPYGRYVSEKNAFVVSIV